MARDRGALPDVGNATWSKIMSAEIRSLSDTELDAVTGGATAIDGLVTVANLIDLSMAAGIFVMMYTVGAVAQMGRTPQPSAW